MAKFRHIAIFTEDPESVAAWYKDVFGLEEVGTNGNGGVYLSDGEVNFAVLRSRNGNNGVSHFGFMVEDPEATYKKLAELGSERLPSVAVAGQYFEVKYRAPDGISFDISEHGWPGAKPVTALAEAAAVS